MGIFGKLFGKKEQSNDISTSTMTSNTASSSKSESKVSLSKEESIKKINLCKEEVHKICLSKTPLNGLTARVGLVLDYSGSMGSLYRNGTVQSVVEKILPIAMEFDDNGAMEVWIFDQGFHRLPDITLDNFYGYVQREILDKGFDMGWTKYSPVMRDVMSKYIDEEPAKMADYIVYITDGENSDKDDTDKTIIEASHHPIFWQFVGVGNEDFEYLTALDDMEGRYIDNADFFKVDKIDNIGYNDLLNEFPDWLKNDKVQEMIK